MKILICRVDMKFDISFTTGQMGNFIFRPVKHQWNYKKTSKKSSSVNKNGTIWFLVGKMRVGKMGVGEVGLTHTILHNTQNVPK